MTNFVKGHWYQNKNTKQYFQCMTERELTGTICRLPEAPKGREMKTRQCDAYKRKENE